MHGPLAWNGMEKQWSVMNHEAETERDDRGVASCVHNAELDKGRGIGHYLVIQTTC